MKRNGKSDEIRRNGEFQKLMQAFDPTTDRGIKRDSITCTFIETKKDIAVSFEIRKEII